MKFHGYQRTPRPSSNSRTFILKDHQGKGTAYGAALKVAGYREVPLATKKATLALYDMDNSARRKALELLHSRNIPIFMYPHGARPPIVWDGIYEVWPHTRCLFVPAPGHQEVLQRFGYPLPIEVTGWSFCEIKPFQPVSGIRNILFAPIHPAPGPHFQTLEVDKQLNLRTYQRLIRYCKETGITLKVRCVGPLENNGLYPDDSVELISGSTRLSIEDIDEADLVVSHQTFAYLAIARGKPTLMMGEDVPPRSCDMKGNLFYVKSWEKYADLLTYPLDVLAENLDEVIQRAIQGSEQAATWRDNFIGRPFDPGYFVSRLESYL